MRTRGVCLWAPLWLLVPATLLFLCSDADLWVARSFADGQHWPLADWRSVRFLYDSGCLPALVLGMGGGVWALLPRISRSSRRAGLLLFATLAIGPGILVNGVLKHVTYRPRPCELKEFGGPNDFAGLGVISYSPQAKSFPSGHAAAGFFLMTPFFALRRRRPTQAGVWLVLGIIAGVLIGWARLAEGRHFLSDVIWSAGVVYGTGLLAHFGLGLHHDFRGDLAGEGRTPPAHRRVFSRMRLSTWRAT